jgi:T5SS/PEP-CTERM-associated repeat protein
MTKTKSKNIIFMLVVALLTLSTTSFAAVYDWIGAVDVDWDNPSNWDVTGSTWTWPNEEYGDSLVNQDCDKINITTGDIVDRIDSLAMSGASEGSNETVLTISNNSGLSIWGHMWIGQNGDGTVKAEVSNGSSLTVGQSLVVGDAEESTGLLDVTDGAVEVMGEMYVGKYDNSTGNLQIKRDVPGVGYDLIVWKDMYVGFRHDSVGTVEIESSSVKFGNKLRIGWESTGMFKIKDSTLSIRGPVEVGYRGSSSGTLEIESSTVDIGGTLNVGRESTGMLKIKDSTLGIDHRLNVGRRAGSTGTVEIEDSTLDIGYNLVVGESTGSTGTLEIKDSTLDIHQSLTLTRAGTSGIMSIKGDSIIIINEQFQMGAKDKMNAVSELVMDDGAVTVGFESRLNMAGAAGSMADFTLNGGTWINRGKGIYVGETTYGDCHLTINGGTMVSDSMIFVGSPGGDDFGQSRIFLNGGLLQGEGLELNIPADSRIVYKGGELWINKSALTEADMQDLIDIGKIDVSAAPVYEITTIGDYTVLRS